MILKNINEIGRRKGKQGGAEVPKIVEAILIDLANGMADFDDPDKAIGDMVGKMDDDGEGTARNRGSYGNHYNPFNLIPSKSKIRGCTELLITVCYNNDNFEKRLLESLDHVSQHCKNTKDIYFITTKWNSSIFDKHQGYIDLLRNSSINIVFVYMGKEGFVMMPD